MAFTDPPNSANYVVFDNGGPIDCDEEPDDPAYAASASIDCVNEAIRITNDGTAPIVGYGSTIGSRREIPAGGSATVPWGRDPGGNLLDPSTWEAYTINADTSETLFDSGSFTLAQYDAQCEAEEELTYTYTAEPVCVADFPHVRFTATGTGDVYIAQNTHSAGLARAGGPPITLPWDEHQAIPFPETDWEAVRTDTSAVFDTGSFTLAEDNPCVTATVPGAPTGLTVTPGNSSVTATWTAPSTTVVLPSPVTGLASLLMEQTGPRSPTAPQPAVSSTGLQNGTRYYVRVQAVNAVGSSAFSSCRSAVPRTVASVPRSLTAVPTNVAGQVQAVLAAPCLQRWLGDHRLRHPALTERHVRLGRRSTTASRTTTTYTVTGLDQRDPLLLPGDRQERRR